MHLHTYLTVGSIALAQGSVLPTQVRYDTSSTSNRSANSSNFSTTLSSGRAAPFVSTLSTQLEDRDAKPGFSGLSNIGKTASAASKAEKAAEKAKKAAAKAAKKAAEDAKKAAEEEHDDGEESEDDQNPRVNGTSIATSTGSRWRSASSLTAVVAAGAVAAFSV